LKIDSYLKVESIDAAYKTLMETSGAEIIGGGAWLKLMPKKISVAIDLSSLGLDEITESEKEIEIGCMVTLRQIEKYPAFSKLYSGIISKSAGSIMGITVRNIATIGGTISGKYGFSDILPVLMAVDAQLNLFKRGRIKLTEFMNETNSEKDILTHIYIKKEKAPGWFTTMKNTAIDFPIINVAGVAFSNGCRIAVGSRPYKAVMAEKSMEYINNCGDPDVEKISAAANIASEEIKFGSNQRGSGDYRKELCRTFIKRGLTEVLL